MANRGISVHRVVVASRTMYSVQSQHQAGRNGEWIECRRGIVYVSVGAPRRGPRPHHALLSCTEHHHLRRRSTQADGCCSQEPTKSTSGFQPCKACRDTGADDCIRAGCCYQAVQQSSIRYRANCGLCAPPFASSLLATRAHGAAVANAAHIEVPVTYSTRMANLSSRSSERESILWIDRKRVLVT